MTPKRFTSLVKEAGLRPNAQSGEADVAWITADTRLCGPGSLFVCMPSKNTDTHALLPQAREAGAVAALVHGSDGFRSAESMRMAVAWVGSEQPSFNVACGSLARAVFGDPSSKMRVVGVTGTNGKTTTAWMMRDALRALGRRAGYMGTLGFDPGGARRELANTTPFPVETWQLLHEAFEAGVEDFVMEASSHALFERRLFGVRFSCGVFTNLSQDHLDFHGTMEEYAAAKYLLFTEYAGAGGTPAPHFASAINVGDPVGAAWARSIDVTVTFGAPGARLGVEALEKHVASLLLRATFDGRAVEFRIGVGGQFNVWNATSSLAGLLALGYGLEEACKAMESVTPVPGRFESVPTGRRFSIIVDYAHTDDALSKLLSSVRELGPSRIITVFGCGGDRDRTKRPKMARAASANSDVTIVTSDNPRTEDPSEIIADVVAGLVPGAVCETIPDRREAIARAVSIARDGDVVVIAGKGHEDYQIIGRTKHPMDDRVLAKEALA
jgi:UDP-N-acetylmuramoyl-L-alanyl-D-glutamate--2,6-diaminopimelate ligase